MAEAARAPRIACSEREPAMNYLCALCEYTTKCSLRQVMFRVLVCVRVWVSEWVSAHWPNIIELPDKKYVFINGYIIQYLAYTLYTLVYHTYNNNRIFGIICVNKCANASRYDYLARLFITIMCICVDVSIGDSGFAYRKHFLYRWLSMCINSRQHENICNVTKYTYIRHSLSVGGHSHRQIQQTSL